MIDLDAAAVLDVARTAVGRPTAELESWRVEQLTGQGFVASIHRVAGTVLDGGERLSWSVIRKTRRTVSGR